MSAREAGESALRAGASLGHATLARYKKAILLGKAELPLEVARRMVGPDCAYHLYFRHSSESGPGPKAKRRRGQRRTR